MESLEETAPCISRRPLRRGTALYVTILTTTLIVSLLALVGLTIVRIERKQMAFSTDMRHARANANSAVELALRVIANDPNWRTTYTNGIETTPQSLGPLATGTLSWILEDSDGSLTDADTYLRLKGVGRVGTTVQVSSIEVEEQLTTADYLRCPIHTQGTLNLQDYATVIGGPFSSNIAIDGTTSPDTFTGDAEAPTYLGDLNKLTGTFTVTGPKDMPPETTFDDIYKPLSSEILYTNLPMQGSFRVMQDVLSPTVNDWGPTNGNGIYYINVPADGKVKLKDFTLSGTLLFEVEAGGKVSSSTLDALHPANPNYPVLIVKANDVDVEFDLAGSNSNASSGLIHFIGNATSSFLIKNSFNHTGTIVTNGTVTMGFTNSNFQPTLTHDPNLEANPPLGYATSDGEGLSPVAGTWLWDAAP